jgi:hypothetical protein
MVITLQLGTQEEVESWANDFGLTHAVVFDGNNSIISSFLPQGGNFGIPNVQVLSPGMKVEIVNEHGINPSQIEGWLPR